MAITILLTAAILAGCRASEHAPEPAGTVAGDTPASAPPNPNPIDFLADNRIARRPDIAPPPKRACVDEILANTEIVEDTVICPGAYSFFSNPGDALFRLSRSNVHLYGRDVSIKDVNGHATAISISLGDGETEPIRNLRVEGFQLTNFDTGVRASSPVEDVTFSLLSISRSRSMHIEIGGGALESTRPFESARVRLENIITEDSALQGISCTNCVDSELFNVRSYSNVNESVESNIALHGGARNKIRRAIVVHRNAGSGCNGIWLDKTTGARVTGSLIEVAPNKDGTHIYGSRDVVFERNEIRSRGNVIDVVDSENVRFTDNVFRIGVLREKRSCLRLEKNLFLGGAWHDKQGRSTCESEKREK
ncbi:MAG: hypothetical protein K8I29_08590 [Alphaproteobacteria bacterium]|uniref:Right handed beta helix domain-containing protein n=1 Tax=Candidatus Nitrobium versatile TaxID=2884831 RepID=A0A953JCJ5_9BACT|nr:hypothetical protein [Candidatus Nitrobium versatile]